MRDTIYALSSGALPAGVAVVRVSGPQADTIVQSLCGFLPMPRHAALANLTHRGVVLDRGLALRFPAPASFTGEDVAEFQVHGGRGVVAALLGALGSFDAVRPASAGEFSRRAFENGKLDLTEAEGLADLIAAETEVQRRQAVLQAGGAFRRRCESWRTRLLAARARIEAELDFADEDDLDTSDIQWMSVVSEVAEEIATTLADQTGERIRDGYRVAIMGLPNSGKSTLFNALVGREAAIVTAEAGTTRDVLEVAMHIGGYPILVSDTAGIRTAVSLAEQEGIRRAKAVGQDADLVIWLAEPGVCLDPGLDAPPSETIRVRSKCDLAPADDGDFAVSAATGVGIDRVKAAIEDRARLAMGTGDGLIARDRHRSWLSVAAEALAQVPTAHAPEFKAALLRDASDAIGRITGRVDVEDVLDALFSEFCIGK